MLEGLLDQSKPPLPSGGERPALPAVDPISLFLAHRFAVSSARRFGHLVWRGGAAHRLRRAGILALAILDRQRRAADHRSVAANRFSRRHRRTPGRFDPVSVSSDRARNGTHPDDYGPTQSFARVVREESIDAIRYESVRDPKHGARRGRASALVFQAAQAPWSSTRGFDGAAKPRSSGSAKARPSNLTPARGVNDSRLGAACVAPRHRHLSTIISLAWCPPCARNDHGNLLDVGIALRSPCCAQAGALCRSA